MLSDSNFITFLNKEGKQFVFSGKTGLVLEYEDSILEYLQKDDLKDEQYEEYLTKELVDFNDLKKSLERTDEKPYLTAVTYFITNQCNLNCSYCYEKVSNVDDSLRMDFNTLKDSIKFIEQNFKLKNSMHINFFGGEPLLNFELMKESVTLLDEFGKRNNIFISYGITTNGTIINDEIVEFLANNNIGILVSIDGTKEIHDSNRVYHSGKGSYDVIVENVSKLSPYVKLCARVTIENYDTDLVNLYNHLTDIGFSEVAFSYVSKIDSHITQSDYDAVKTTLSSLAEYFLNQVKEKHLPSIKIFIDTLINLHSGSRSDMRLFPCGAAKNYFAIDPKGDIYVCHRFGNMDNFKWGNIYEGFDEKKQLDFLRDHVLCERGNGECRECWAKYFCGGACYHSSYDSYDDSTKNTKFHCFYMKEVLKNSLYIYTSLSTDEKKIFDNIEPRQNIYEPIV